MVKDSEEDYDGSDAEDEEEDEEEETEFVPALATRERRTNRAQHMSSLISEVVEKGDQFWRNEDWAMSEEEGGESADDSFELSAEDDRPDEFDSDFNDTEDENEEDEEGGSEAEERSGRRRTAGSSRARGKVTIGAAKKASVYKEPPKPKAPRVARAPVDREAAKKRRAEDFKVQLQEGDEAAIAKRVRQSTKQKTQHAEAERQMRQHQQLVVGSKRPPRSDAKPTFNQRDMLAEALETEQVNTKWLRIQQMVEDEMARSDKHPVLDGSKKVVRHLARRGTYPTITFVNSDSLPVVLQAGAHVRPSEVVRTGAKYRDPVTGRAYSTVEEFQTLRRESGVPFVHS